MLLDTCSFFLNSGKGRGSEDHCLQKRPQQGVRLKDEVIPDVVQRHREALRYDAFHSEVAFLFYFFTSPPLFLMLRETISMLLCIFYEDNDHSRKMILRPFGPMH